VVGERGRKGRDRTGTIDYRCAIVERKLAGLYKRRGLPRRERVPKGRAALEFALRDDEWGSPHRGARSARRFELFGSLALARAYLDEDERGLQANARSSGAARLRAQVACRAPLPADASRARRSAAVRERRDQRQSLRALLRLARLGRPSVSDDEASKLIARCSARDAALRPRSSPKDGSAPRDRP